MAAGGLRWYVQVIILWTVKTKPCSLFIPFWQDIIVLHPQQGEKQHAGCAFPRLMSVPISTDVLLNMYLTVLLQIRLHRYVWRLLVGNTYFPTLKKILRQQEIFAHCSERNSFVKWNPRFNIHIKSLLSYLILDLLLTLSVLMITLMFCSSETLSFIQFKY